MRNEETHRLFENRLGMPLPPKLTSRVSLLRAAPERRGQPDGVDRGEGRSAGGWEAAADKARVRDDVEHTRGACGRACIFVIGDEGESICAPSGNSNGDPDDACNGNGADRRECGLVERLNGVVGGARLCGGLAEDENAAERVVDDEQARGVECAYLQGGSGIDDLAIVVVNVPGRSVEVDLASDCPKRVVDGVGESDSG